MPSWDGVIRLRAPARLSDLAEQLGGEVRRDARDLVDTSGVVRTARVARVSPVELAGDGDLAPLVSRRYLRAAKVALARGASLLVDDSLSKWIPVGAPAWVHAQASWALARVLAECIVPDAPAEIGEGTTLGANVSLGPRVVIGRNVTIGAGTVIGAPGFGWATSPSGETVRVPQLGGVVIDDDVAIGPLSTIDAGTLEATRIRRGARLDAQIHVGHNVEIGEGTIIAAQSGFAGSVRIGRGVLIGGQVGIADHVTVGDGAKIAAKSGVIGDVPAGAVVAGYPAVPRGRWLRALARLYRLA